jgi:hypothetical protein
LEEAKPIMKKINMNEIIMVKTKTIKIIMAKLNMVELEMIKSNHE